MNQFARLIGFFRPTPAWEPNRSYQCSREHHGAVVDVPRPAAESTAHRFARYAVTFVLLAIALWVVTYFNPNGVLTSHFVRFAMMLVAAYIALFMRWYVKG